MSVSQAIGDCLADNETAVEDIEAVDEIGAKQPARGYICVPAYWVTLAKAKSRGAQNS